MKFLVDMPLSPGLALWLTRQGHEAVHASDLGLAFAPDDEILKVSASERRVIVTADLDYPRLLALTNADAPGLILFRGGSYSEQESLDLLARLFEIVAIDDLYNSIFVLEKTRIRRRQLPL